MTLTLREAMFAIFGAWRLAWMDRSGLHYFDRSADGALRSFFAALIVLPGYAVLVLLRLWDQLPQVSALRFISVEGIAYVVSWTAFALAMHSITRAIGRERNYLGWLCAYNWSQVIQMAAYLPAIAIAESGLVPSSIGDFLVMAVTLAVLVYQWFVARSALEISGVAAAGTVALDFLLAVLITDFADGML